MITVEHRPWLAPGVVRVLMDQGAHQSMAEELTPGQAFALAGRLRLLAQEALDATGERAPSDPTPSDP